MITHGTSSDSESTVSGQSMSRPSFVSFICFLVRVGQSLKFALCFYLKGSVRIQMYTEGSAFCLAEESTLD